MPSNTPMNSRLRSQQSLYCRELLADFNLIRILFIGLILYDLNEIWHLYEIVLIYIRINSRWSVLKRFDLTHYYRETYFHREIRRRKTRNILFPNNVRCALNKLSLNHVNDYPSARAKIFDLKKLDFENFCNIAIFAIQLCSFQ